jgi:lycopene beta-cyclase
MTYFGFLARFVVIPIILLWCLHLSKPQKYRAFVGAGNGKSVWIAVGVQIALALLYTTPWDNYLVATGVWHYNPRLVIGMILGYVPLEEYTFFVLETLLVGLWWLLVSQRIKAADNFQPSWKLRLWSAGTLAAVCITSMLVFFSGWKPGTYLLITFVWALPPIILQLAFGADILWHHRKLVVGVILPIGLYLSFVDALAIQASIWAIDPAQSTGLFIGSLPLEEGVFFFVTAMLITLGMTLTLSAESRKRFPFKSQEMRSELRETV